MSGLRLVVFDCDGTLVDSQAAIIHAMRDAFAKTGVEAPTDEAIRRTVGLSVPDAVRALCPKSDGETLGLLDRRYREASFEWRKTNPGQSAPLYPGARDALDRLDRAGELMGVATGKARRGLDHLFETYDLGRYFIASQSADDAPSKPHPGMLENCARLTGATEMVMVGDTTFDIQMARSFGCPAIGVSWGYHPTEALTEAGAALVIDDFASLDSALLSIWST